MPTCAAKDCQTTCTLRFCDACYKAHQAKLTNICKTCHKKIIAHHEYCKNCEAATAKANTCKQCKQTCKIGTYYCSDCRQEHNKTSTSRKLPDASEVSVIIAILDKICESCGGASDSRFCYECKEKFKSELRPCADCGKTLTNGRYCEPCIIAFKSKQTENHCGDCSAVIPAHKKFCSACVSAFKANMHPCRTQTCENITLLIYCDVCSSAHKLEHTNLIEK